MAYCLICGPLLVSDIVDQFFFATNSVLCCRAAATHAAAIALSRDCTEGEEAELATPEFGIPPRGDAEHVRELTGDPAVGVVDTGEAWAALE